MAEKPEVEASHYERVGRALENIFISAYANKKRVYLVSFWRGIAFGTGSAIGGTIVLALVLFFLSQVSDIPFLGDIAEKISNALSSD